MFFGLNEISTTLENYLRNKRSTLNDVNTLAVTVISGSADFQGIDCRFHEGKLVASGPLRGTGVKNWCDHNLASDLPSQ